MTTPLLRIDRVTKRFGGHVAVDDLSLDLASGEFFALLGPSGCGKTTLLRMLAGFERPDSGALRLDGQDIAAVPPHRRPVNMMFQNYALFPHLDVVDNIAFGLRRTGLPKAEIAARTAEMLALVRLDGLEHRRPDQLSGGQRQRVALARALARRPRLLLLDEPLAALDKALREATQAELRRVQQSLGTTFVIVTHDQDEAMALADRIGVMADGRLVQVATPRDLYARPATRFAAEFIGDINFVSGRVTEITEQTITVATAQGDVSVHGEYGGRRPGDDVLIAIRPEAVTLAREAAHPPDAYTRDGTIVAASFRGGEIITTVTLDDGVTWRVRGAAHSVEPFAPGDHVALRFDPRDATLVQP